MAKFRMKRIEPPEWATQPELSISRVTVAEFAAMQRHREKMLRSIRPQLLYLQRRNRLAWRLEFGLFVILTYLRRAMRFPHPLLPKHLHLRILPSRVD